MLGLGLQVTKSITGSGGFKVPQEYVDKRQSRHKQNIHSDLPSREELYSQLGVPNDDLSMRHTAGQGDIIQESRKLILQKQAQLNDLPPKPTNAQPVPIRKQQIPKQNLSSDDIEKMLQQHRTQMEPLEQQYQQARQEGMQRHQNSTYRSFTPPPRKSSKVKVTYHKQSESLEKLQKSQHDLNGPHGGFLKGVMPKERVQKYTQDAKVVSDADFQHKFKQYLRNKQGVVNDDSRVEFELYQSTSPNPGRWNVKHSHKMKGDRSVYSSRSKSSKRLPKKHTVEEENYMIEQIFKQIDTNKQQKIDKISAIKHLTSNPQIMDAFDIHTKELNSKVNKFPTKDSNSFTLQEFTNFLKRFKPQLNHESFGGLSHVSQAQMQSSCLLTEQHLQTMKKVFDELQIDMVAPRKELIQALRNDVGVIRILHIQAAYISQIDKIMTLDKVLGQIESHDEEYISWKQFMDSFEYDTPVSKQQVSYVGLRDTQVVDDQDRIDAPKELLELIKESYQLLKQDDYVYTYDMLDSIRRTPLYSKIHKQPVRLKETLEQLCKRIEEDAHEYLAYNEFMQYFSRRGTPKFEEEVASLAKSVNVTEAYRNNEGIDGYDSDPELHTYQDRQLPRQRLNKNSYSSKGLLTYSHRKSNHSSKSPKPRTREDFLSAIQPKGFGAASKPSDYNFRVTTPKPYKFDARTRSQSIREKKLEEMLLESKKSLQFSPFRAKEVPQHVKQPLYEKIMNDQQRHREEVKRNSMAMTRRNERPFSFYHRKEKAPRKKYFHERQKYVFKAKAIPWHVHVNLLEQMHQDEEVKRQERIAKHAQELAMNSRMPARMEQHERQKQAIQASPKHTRTQVVLKAKEMPDFDRLHSTFQESLNRKKQQMRTTEPSPFNFQQSHRSVDRPYMDLENTKQIVVVKEDKIVEARRKMEQKPLRQPPSTKKWETTLEYYKKQKQEKLKKEQAIAKEDEERKLRKEKFRKRVQQSEGIQDNTKKLEQQRKDRIAQLKKESKEQEVKQKQRIQDCIKKAQDQPLLVERPTKRDVKMEKMKQLNKMDKILKTNGVNRDDYFNKEEKEMLKDMDYLKSHGYEDDFEKE